MAAFAGALVDCFAVAFAPVAAEAADLAAMTGARFVAGEVAGGFTATRGGAGLRATFATLAFAGVAFAVVALPVAGFAADGFVAPTFIGPVFAGPAFVTGDFVAAGRAAALGFTAVLADALTAGFSPPTLTVDFFAAVLADAWAADLSESRVGVFNATFRILLAPARPASQAFG